MPTKSPSRDHYDAIVIGAGLGGLSTAAYLARAGKRVLVLDQQYVAGGSSVQFRRRQHRFDVGLHYIGDCGPDGVIPKVLRGLGLASRIAFREMDPDGFDVYHFPDFEFRVPKGEEVFAERLSAMFPREQRGIRHYVSTLRQSWDGTAAADRFEDALRPSVRHFGRFVRGVGHLGACLMRYPQFFRYAQATLARFLDDVSPTPELRAILLGQTGTYGVPPRKASALLHNLLAMHYFRGAYYPQGGGQALADALCEHIEGHGGEIALCTRVTRVVVQGGRARGVQTSHRQRGAQTFCADVVVSAGDLARTYLELVGPEHLQPSTARWVRGLEMAAPLFVVYLGVAKSLAHLGNANHWVYDHYDIDAAYAQSARHATGYPWIYISTASLRDAGNTSLAPPGQHNVQLMTVAPAAPAAWGASDTALRDGSYRQLEAYQQRKAALAQAMIQGAERVIPGLGDSIVYRETATPLTHTRYTLSSGGTSYGLAATPRQFGIHRPGPRTEIPGLYLAGVNIRSGHGIVGALVSGVYCAAAVLRQPLVAQVLR